MAVQTVLWDNFPFPSVTIHLAYLPVSVPLLQFILILLSVPLQKFAPLPCLYYRQTLHPQHTSLLMCLPSADSKLYSMCRRAWLQLCGYGAIWTSALRLLKLRQRCVCVGGFTGRVFFIFPFLQFSGHFVVFRITFTTSEWMYSFRPVLYFNGLFKIHTLYQCDLSWPLWSTHRLSSINIT